MKSMIFRVHIWSDVKILPNVSCEFIIKIFWLDSIRKSADFFFFRNIDCIKKLEQKQLFFVTLLPTLIPSPYCSVIGKSFGKKFDGYLSPFSYIT